MKAVVIVKDKLLRESQCLKKLNFYGVEKSTLFLCNLNGKMASGTYSHLYPNEDVEVVKRLDQII